MQIDQTEIQLDGGPVRVLTPDAERIDAAAAIQFKDAMRALTRDAPPRVILDLCRVRFIDSSGLGAIVAALKQMPDGANLELAGLLGTVAKVFQLTRMDTVFRIHESLPPARNTCG